MSTPTQTAGELKQDPDEREYVARRYVEQVRVFHAHASVFAAGMTIVFAVNLLTSLSAVIAGERSAW